MRQDLDLRCVEIARYILQTGATIREAAQEFSLGKSTVHKDLQERLKITHPGLYEETRRVLSYHQAVRHLRGGAATRRRWMKNVNSK